MLSGIRSFRACLRLAARVGPPPDESRNVFLLGPFNCHRTPPCFPFDAPLNCLAHPRPKFLRRQGVKLDTTGPIQVLESCRAGITLLYTERWQAKIADVAFMDGKARECEPSGWPVALDAAADIVFDLAPAGVVVPQVENVDRLCHAKVPLSDLMGTGCGGKSPADVDRHSQLVRDRLNRPYNRIFFAPDLNVIRLVLPVVASILVPQCSQSVCKVIEGARRICGPRTVHNPIEWNLSQLSGLR